MEERSSTGKSYLRRQTRWDGLFVSEHAWDFNNDAVNDPQPMLSADEQGAIIDMLIVACERKCAVFIQSWQERHFHYYRCTIQKLDQEQWTITYEDSFGERQLAIGMITSIHMLD
ncbi:YolD-like family protein [Planococcus soli]|uniref:YolD-like family protein n=1 Tax=Planococcus soli TaxID=2666072 RepID=UPI00115D2A69|nr:YolD-like family protein [Planococcus soli]